MNERHVLTRRDLLRLGVGLGATLAVGATHAPSVRGALERAAASARASAQTDDVQVVVGDVLDFTLDAEGRWPGPFGSVTLRLNRGLFDGEDVWFIRTDTSDPIFAREQGLVFVPVLAGALNAPDSHARLYTFTQGAGGQAPVMTTVPGRDDFTPAFRVHRVTFAGSPEVLDSEAAIQAAAAAGRARVEQTSIIVNYPLVLWPGGGLTRDSSLAEPLGSGPLIEEPDTVGGRVVFKLHQCFPGSRYIVTDTSAVPMAPMMGVVGSGRTQLLKDARATAPITIFVNGLPGPGVMGFQPAIFNVKAGEPAWSPFWDHFAVSWRDPSHATVVRSQAELDQRVAAGELERFNGVPDTHPNGFVVNCPSPVLAPNTYTGGS